MGLLDSRLEDVVTAKPDDDELPLAPIQTSDLISPSYVRHSEL